MKRGKPAAALDCLFAALEAGEPMYDPYISEIIESIFALLSEGSLAPEEYRARLAEIAHKDSHRD